MEDHHEIEQPRPRRRRWRRPLGCLVIAALVPIAVVNLVLHTEAGRDWLGDRVVAAVASRTGLELELPDWRLWPLRGRLELWSPRLRNMEGEAVASADVVTARFSPTALLQRPLRLRSLVVTGLEIDLTAELPPARARESDAASVDEWPILLDRFEITNGRLLPPQPGEEAAGWVDGWRVEAVALSGAIELTGLQARLGNSSVIVDGSELGPPIPIEVTARVAMESPLAPFSLDEVRVRGPGLEATASGQLALSEAQPSELAIELAAEAGQLAPRLSTGGSAQLRGTVDLRTRKAKLSLRAEDFPAGLLQPLIGAETLARLEGERTTLDATAELTFDASAPDPIDAQATLGWIRGDSSLLTASLVTRGGGRDADGELSLRTLRGDLVLRSAGLPAEVLQPWIGRQRFADMSLAGTALDLVAELGSVGLDESTVVADVEATWRRRRDTLVTLASGLTLERDLESSKVELSSGHLQLKTAELSAPLLRPFLDEATWRLLAAEDTVFSASADLRLREVDSRPGGLLGSATLAWKREQERLLALDVVGVAATGAGLRLEVEADLLPGAAGTRRLSAQLSAAERSTPLAAEWEQGRIALDLPDVLAAIGDVREHLPGLLEAVEPQSLQRLAGGLAAEVQLAGQLLDPMIGVDGRWRAAGGGELRLEATGALRPLQGEAHLAIDDYHLAQLEREWQGTISGTLDLEGDGESFSGAARLRSPELSHPTIEPIRDVVLAGGFDRDGIVVEELTGGFREGLFEVTGTARLPDLAQRPWALPQPARLTVALVRPMRGVQHLDSVITLEGDRLEVETTRLESDAGTGHLRLRAAIAHFLAIEKLEPVLARFDLPAASESVPPIQLEVDLPDLDSQKLLAFLGLEPREERAVVRNLRALFELDLDNWHEVRGTLDTGEIAFFDERHFFESPGAHLEVAGGRMRLDPMVLVDTTRQDRRLTLSGDAELAADWGLGKPIAQLVPTVDLEAQGVAPAALLQPWLGGGVVAGLLELDFELTAAGGLDDYRGRLEARSDNATLLYIQPYETRIEKPEIKVFFDRHGIQIEQARVELNRGAAELTGRYEETSGLLLSADLSEVRYRLDYGLSAMLSGQLELTLPPEGSGELSGALVLERGFVRNDIDLERELRGLLLGIPDLTGTESTFADRLDLRLSVATLNGVRVDNNLGDLTAVWQPLTVRGTLAEPLIEGQIQVDPGGLFFAYGQVFRLDQATIELSGIPEVPPKIEASTTSSVEDPSLLRHGKSDPFASPSAVADPVDPQTALTAGLADYYGGMLGQALSDSLGGVRVEIEPQLLFTESDPDARLTLTQDLSRYLALGVSLNLRRSERRTYLLDIHELDFAPRLSAQVFTNEEDNQGVTVQHGIDLGAGSRRAEGEVISRIVLPTVPHISRRGLRRSVGIDDKDVLVDGSLFDVEVSLADHLRGNGYPAARATVEPRPGKRQNEVELEASFELGPFVRFDFSGEVPPARSRELIRALYRPDFYREEALAAMREATVRALRSEGYLDPQVEIEVELAAPAEGGEQTVHVHAEGGRLVKLRDLAFSGVDEEEAAFLAARFRGTLARIELAAGLPSAERRLLGSLESLGHPQAEIVDRAISEEGGQLAITVAPGPRRTIADLEIRGLEPDERSRLEPLLPIARGSVARSDWIARAAFMIERDLRNRGFAQARVRPIQRLGDSDFEATIVLDVERGPRFEVGNVAFDGAIATRPKWARNLVSLEEGAPLRREQLAEARRRLLRTGSFSSITVDTRKPEEGGRSDVVFGLTERPRYRISYGLRWESGDDLGAVVDLRDRNLFGRGITVGARYLETGREQDARLFGSVPRLFGSKITVDLLAEVNELVDEGFITQREQASLQLSRPFGPHITGRVYGRFREERFFEEDPDPFFPIDEKLQSPFVGVQLVYDERENRPFGREGLFASVDLSGANENLGSDFRYRRLFGQINYVTRIVRLGWRRVVWAQSVRVGVARTFSEQVLLGDVRFFTGGEYSVRGYATESLSPVERLGDREVRIGGDSVLVINQELRVPIVSRYQGVLFYDAGNAFAPGENFGSELFSAAGLGLRATTPIGLLRLDLAFPLDRRAEDDRYKVYFGFGQVF